jgi:hypothetical protein
MSDAVAKKHYRLARTEQRLQWYLLGLEEAKPGYRGRVFSLPPGERERVSNRAHGAISSLQDKNPPAGRGLDRTVSRLGWYMDGLRDAAPGYQGRIFALQAAQRDERKERIRSVLCRLEVPPAANPALRS